VVVLACCTVTWADCQQPLRVINGWFGQCLSDLDGNGRIRIFFPSRLINWEVCVSLGVCFMFHVYDAYQLCFDAA
jgi:hypothetical protein